MRLFRISVLLDDDRLCGLPTSFVAPLIGLRTAAKLPAGAIPLAIAEGDSRRDEVVIAYEHANQIRFNFDSQATVTAIKEERYREALAPPILASALPFDYNWLPVRLIGLMSRLLSKPVRLADLPSFPAYPLDQSADALAALGGLRWPNRSAIWPDGKKFAVCLTHDVDRNWLLHNPAWLDSVLAIEHGLGLRSAWYVVPGSITDDRSRYALAQLADQGHEIGIHGFDHRPELGLDLDGRLTEKLEAGKAFLENYSAYDAGFRSPWLSRSDKLYEALQQASFLYDSSVPVSTYVQGDNHWNAGCGTLHPFIRNGIVVLPMTLPMDAVRRSLGLAPATFWEWLAELTETIKGSGGLAMITTHIEPHFTANREMLDGYQEFLRRFTADEEAWHVLPRDIAVWARRRDS